MLGSVGGNAQQHIGAEHVEQKYDVKEAGKVEHGYGCGYILYEYKKYSFAKIFNKQFAL